jgi:LSD1 subclass zinc finger protein
VCERPWITPRKGRRAGCCSMLPLGGGLWSGLAFDAPSFFWGHVMYRCLCGQVLCIPVGAKTIRCPACQAVLAVAQPAPPHTSRAAVMVAKAAPITPAPAPPNLGDAAPAKPHPPPFKRAFLSYFGMGALMSKDARSKKSALVAGGLVAALIASMGCVALGSCSGWIFTSSDHGWGKKRFTAGEILALKKGNPAQFKEKMEGKLVSVRGTVHFTPVFWNGPTEETRDFVAVQLEGSDDFTHESPRVMVYFFGNDTRQFTPKFLDWVKSTRAGDRIEVSGTVKTGNTPENPILIWNAKLEGF